MLISRNFVRLLILTSEVSPEKQKNLKMLCWSAKYKAGYNMRTSSHRLTVKCTFERIFKSINCQSHLTFKLLEIHLRESRCSKISLLIILPITFIQLLKVYYQPRFHTSMRLLTVLIGYCRHNVDSYQSVQTSIGLLDVTTSRWWTSLVKS